MKKLLLIILFIVTIILYKNKQLEKQQLVIPNNSIRLRVLANSNSKEDQDMKIKLTLEAHSIINELLKDVDSKEEADYIIRNNITNINEKIKNKLSDLNYNGTYYLSYGNTFFPEKRYDDIIYNKGYYDSILITLGKGEGKNWWCVLFPPLCLMETQKDNVDKVEYKFFIKDMINKYF